MKKRIFWSILSTSILVLLITFSISTIVMYSILQDEKKSEIADTAVYLTAAYNQNGTDYFETLTDFPDRITIISNNGNVIYDSSSDYSLMPCHIDRQEVISAMENGTGTALRDSETVGQMLYYYAVFLDDGNILRVSSPMESVSVILDKTSVFFFIIMLVSLIIAAISAKKLTSMIVKPINILNLDKPVPSNIYPELSPLMLHMQNQKETIAKQLEELSVKQKEFLEITEKLDETLVIFGADKKVITSNFGAKRLFSCYNTDGISYLELCQDRVYAKAIEKAFSGHRCEEKFQKNGKIYRLTVNPVKTNNNYAAVMFAVDITESALAEKLRREFSANVSHELKTPLTSIMGYAEIMNAGIAKPEDYQRFTGKIYDEAKRLLTLIDDIIKLSKLDENNIEDEFVKVNFKEISLSVINELSDKAGKKNISLDFYGDDVYVLGLENTLHEMVYNLCDNAISYNKNDGYVKITLFEGGGKVVLSVKDNGIGIAKANQSRIFERFYRVDKSHSNITGGTGLGLSIVKHAAIIHKAEISIESELGKGTEISVIFTSIKE